MTNSKYIKYCEDDTKMEVRKSENENLEQFQNRKYAEYFEEHIEEEIATRPVYQHNHCQTQHLLFTQAGRHLPPWNI